MTSCTAAPKNRPVVVQHRGEFNPTFLVVVAGQTVEMPNQDEVAHNVYSTSPAKTFDLGYYAEGEHKEVTFEQAGLVELACSLHKFMRGRILVVPNPYFAAVKPDGVFQIHHVPAGNYSIKLWSDGKELTRHVNIPVSGTVEVDLDLTTSDMAVAKQ
jgi:plastocyanin